MREGIKSAACSARVRDGTGCWIMLAKEMGLFRENNITS